MKMGGKAMKRHPKPGQSRPGTADKIMIVPGAQIYYNLNTGKQSKYVKGGVGHVNIHDDVDNRNGRISHHSVDRLS